VRVKAFLLQSPPVAEDKKTQLGTTGRTVRPTGSPPIAAAVTTPAPAPSLPSATPAPAQPPAPDGHPSPAVKQTSYLPEVPDPLLGATVAGRYLIERKLGEGGMGAVYLATHKVLEKHVALKVLHGEFARKPDLVERFMQEAKAASRIRHENVIDISDFGSTAEGQVFFAMELLTGRDLHAEIGHARVAGQLLPWARTKRIFLQMCSALAAAHARGIVHRDLKPENIFLVEFLGDPDFVKLLDFGIAKLTDTGSEGSDGRKLTKTGMLFGTPEYMSPEQARGESVDHRVDVYAMGCILFQLVTGQVPFQADNFMGVLSLHLTEEPPVIPPEVFDHIGAPRALAGVIDHALLKDRDARLQSMDAFAAAVREVCGDPAPADRSSRVSVAAVPAPATGTTRKREPTQRVRKTEWTGRVSVPEVEVEHAAPGGPPRSAGKSWVVFGGIGIVVIGGIVAFAVTRAGSAPATTADPTAAAASPSGSGSTTSPTPPTGPATAVTPPEPEATPLPELAKLAIDSTPHGAIVTDVSTGKVVGRTPIEYSVPGSQALHRFSFHLAGYADATFGFVPDHEQVTCNATLTHGTPNGAAVPHGDPNAAKPGSGAVTSPGQSEAITRPDQMQTQGKPEGRPEAKPETSTTPKANQPKPDDCVDGEPCLKRDIPGLGGSGAPAKPSAPAQPTGTPAAPAAQ
jgi:eukaryotic-like serine/threonine-protein kinase